MSFALGAVAHKAGYGLEAHDSLGSTNAEGLLRAGAGILRPLWIVTAHQTAGHGRRGRAWETGRGNLAASLVIPDIEDRPVAAGLGFVAGLALNAAITAVAPRVSARTALDGYEAPGNRLALKWPNDVLLDGAKLAGVLVEVQALEGAGLTAVIGIGVNVAAAPVDTPYPATSLAQLGSTATAADLFAALSDAWVGFHAIWNGGRGLPDIRRLWLEQAAGIGAPVAIRHGDDVIRGTFETLDDEGRLVVLTDAGSRRLIAAGEVHFGTAATMR
jgi:BirA family transcriptional regulator, biotin operon repressor / biotin---[acetyl-CoA-carboxylase] ligase